MIRRTSQNSWDIEYASSHVDRNEDTHVVATKEGIDVHGSVIPWSEIDEARQAVGPSLYSVHDARSLLSQIGLVIGEGFEGEVWVNTDTAMCYVCVQIEGVFTGGDGWWDATNGLDLGAFLNWWAELTIKEMHEAHDRPH